MRGLFPTTTCHGGLTPGALAAPVRPAANAEGDRGSDALMKAVVPGPARPAADPARRPDAAADADADIHCGSERT